MTAQRFLSGMSGGPGKWISAGFVLLEVLLAMVVFSISIVSLVNSLVQSFRAEVYSRDYTDAVSGADNLMAHVWARGMMERQTHEEGTFPVMSRDFVYHIRASQSADPNMGNGVNEFFVEVTWNLGGKKRAFSWRGFIFDAS